MSKYLLVGLGNIGEQYVNTRHNIGFYILDYLAQTAKASFGIRRYASITECSYKGKTLILAKPSTYVNLSGEAVRYWVQKYKISITNLLIIVDDLALPLGTLRLKPQGNDGGHNGLKNISEILETSNYARLRFGIGNNYAKGSQVNYVLGKWTFEEMEIINTKMDKAVQIIKNFAAIGIESTMTNFNE